MNAGPGEAPDENAAADGDPRDGPGQPDDHGDEPGQPDDPEGWRHETARINGIDIHYVTVDPDPDAVDHPTGDAPLVVLLHGFPEFWYAWRHQLDPLAEAGFRVVAPDLRGYNRSSQPEGVASYRVAELVADVRGLVAHLGYAQADVVGHDWGGSIAWEVAIADPDLLRRLAILNAPHPEAFRRTLFRSLEQMRKSWYVLFFQFPWLPETVLSLDDHNAIGDMLDEAAQPDAFTDADVRRYKDAMARSGSMSGPLNYYRAIFRQNVRKGLGSILPGSTRRDTTVHVPTLVVWGEQDSALSTRLLDGLDQWVPDLRVERLPEASHWVQADDPERVNDLLVDFLTG